LIHTDTVSFNQEVVVSEKVRLLNNEEGAASSWTFILLISLIIVIVAAIHLYLPRPEAPEPQPVVAGERDGDAIMRFYER
jgi:uncharacterized membrane protein